MKRDVSFLKNLEGNLSKIKQEDRDFILSKYRKIISNEKKKGKKVTDIINEIGNPEEIAKKEIKLLKSNKKTTFKDVMNVLTKDIQIKKKEVKFIDVDTKGNEKKTSSLKKKLDKKKREEKEKKELEKLIKKIV